MSPPKKGNAPDRVVYTIYKYPPEDPDHYVVRKWFKREGSDHLIPDGIVARSDTIEQARAEIPKTLSLWPSVSGDGEPKIFETYF